MDFPRMGAGEFAAQLSQDHMVQDSVGGEDGADGLVERWYRLVLPAGYDASEQAARLKVEIEAVLERPCVVVDGEKGPLALRDAVRAAGASPMVILGVDRYTQKDWRHVDLLRSQLSGGGTKVLLCGLAVLSHMEKWAANLTSFVGGATWQLDPQADELTDAEREARLQALRTAWQQTDPEVIALAEQKRLPPEPDYAEWLVLLGKGELL